MTVNTSARFVILNREDIEKALDTDTCIDLMKTTMETVSRRAIEMPLRQIMDVPGSEQHLGIMPGYLAEPAVWGTKLICLVPENPGRGLSSHTGVVLLYDLITGQLRALLDAAAITALRTPAATAAASRALARTDARTIAILGAGEQAHGHLDALVCAHSPAQIRLWARDSAALDKLADRARTLSDASVILCEDVRDAMRGAEVVTSLTGTTDPIIMGEWMEPGMHLNLVGSSIPAKAEIDADGVAKGRFYVDYRPSAERQAGELQRAVAARVVGLDHIVGEIGEVHLGIVPGRTSDDDITIYKSLGVAAQDLATADAVYHASMASGRGQSATF